MKCLRCGYCCKYCWVIVLADGKKPPTPGNLIEHRGDGTPCRHLKGAKPGKYRCAVHDSRHYRGTPCDRHGQIESSPKNKCRMGEYILKKEAECPGTCS